MYRVNEKSDVTCNSQKGEQQFKTKEETLPVSLVAVHSVFHDSPWIFSLNIIAPFSLITIMYTSPLFPWDTARVRKGSPKSSEITHDAMRWEINYVSKGE